MPLYFVCLCLLCSGANAKRRSPIKQVRYLMGTLCEIAVYPPHQVPGVNPEAHLSPEEAANQAIDAAFRELKRIENLLSNWNPESELMKMNRAAEAAGEVRPSVRVGDELFDRIQVALSIAKESGGAFDPTVGPLVRAWGFLPACVTTPCTGPRETLSDIRKRVGWQKVSLDPATREVHFAVAGMEIDFGGIAKGYAVERAARVLQEHGIHDALLNLGTSSVKALGQPDWYPGCPQRRGDGCIAWQLSIADPRDRAKTAGTIFLRDGEALATSGTYERTTGTGQRRRSHLIDPATGQALGGTVSVTIIGPDAEVADALTKRFILRRDLRSPDARRLIRKYSLRRIELISVRNGNLEHASAGLALRGRKPGAE